MKLLITELDNVDEAPEYDLLQRAEGKAGNEYVYLAGCGSTVVGSWVTYDEEGATTLLTADAIGPVAVAMAITDATSEYGWYQIYGKAQAKIIANTSADVQIGKETTNGIAGDGADGADLIYGAMSREETTTGAVVTVQLFYPFVTDNS